MAIAGTAVLLALLGFVAYRLRWHDWIRPYVLYAAGRTGGCSLAVSRTYRRTRLREAARSARSKMRILRKTDDGFALLGTPARLYWIPATTAESDLTLVLAEQELKVYGAGQYGVRPGDIVLDCGANVGFFTAEALAEGAELVVAIEPVPSHVECLRRTFEAEISAGRVVVYPKGVWDKDDSLEMFLYRDGELDSFVMKEQSAESLPGSRLSVTTIDHLVKELNLPRVDFIKMDIEGAEAKALAGAQATLALHKPRLAVATEHFRDDYLVVPQVVRRAWPGYRSASEFCSLKSRFQMGPDVLYFY